MITSKLSRRSLVLLLLAWGPLPSTEAQAVRRPNILFFLTDDQRHDLMGCAGHPLLRTPTIDALAARGVRFTGCFVTTPICAASRATILTGLHERTHGFTFGTPPLNAKDCAEAYPARLRAAGYRTGFIGKWGIRMAEGQRKPLFDRFTPLSRSPYFKKQENGSRRHVSEIAGDHAIAFLREQGTDHPFCLSISFNAPHAEDGDKKDHFPYPAAVADLYDEALMPLPRLGASEIFASQPEFLRSSLNRRRWFWRWDEGEKYQRNLRDYFRMISGIDGVMKRVLTELERLGLANDTVVVFSSDNGYYLGDRGFAGKWSHYDQSLRVPLVIFDPRLPAPLRGSTVDELTLNADLAPTFLELAGVTPPTRYQGASLLPLLRGRQVEGWREDLFCEHLFRHEAIPRWEGIRGRRFSYANYFEQKPPFEFLHDLDADPDQLINLATDPQHAEKLAEARRRCALLRDRFRSARRR